MLDLVARKPHGMPTNLLTGFFTGDVEAWGLVVPRFGRSPRKFTLQMSGSWTGSRLVLAERFAFADGQIDDRIWEFDFEPGGAFTGRCDELAKWGSGFVSCEELVMQYQFNLRIRNRVVPVQFDDRMYRIDERTISNRAVMYKFGIRLGEVNAVFRKTRS